MTDHAVISAVAPGKVILFGEHAINRGQPALSAAVGLYATCRLSPNAAGLLFKSAHREQSAARGSILDLAHQVDQWRAAEDFDSIRKLARSDYFGPQKYILARMFADQLPDGMSLQWDSQVPPHSGLGSGGSVFVAMVSAVAARYIPQATIEQRSAWAHCGDIIAHGGVASALDTQTSLLGGVIRFTGQGLATQIPVATGLSLIIADSGIAAATSEVNTRVRMWLAEKPTTRMPIFKTIGALTRAAETALSRGDWDELGRLMNLNQLVLEKIGVSVPRIDDLITAALEAGAYGAKISGSGGGGIIIALAPADATGRVADALNAAGGRVMVPQVGVSGVRVETLQRVG